MTAVKTKRDFTTGPLFFNMIAFAIPIMLTNVLQLMYNVADNIVVGRFSGDLFALGAVGATSPFTNLLISFITGLSAGASIVVAQLWGARQDGKTVSRSVHTIMTSAAILGVVLMVLGLFVSEPMLRLMGTADEFMSRSLLYAKIICIGFPASAIYNFGSAILRAVGNSRIPLYVLAATGLVNVGLNFLFVLAFDMSVDGVATATVISQYLSAIVIVFLLMRAKGKPYAFSVKQMRIYCSHLSRVALFGLPSAVQSCMFSLGNVILRSAINTLPTVVSTAHTIAFNLDGIVHAVMTSFIPVALTFVGQNYGAKKTDRIKRVLLFGLVQVITIAVLISILMMVLAPEIAVIFIDEKDGNKELIIETARQIIFCILPLYFLLGVSEFIAGVIRGMGYSIRSMINAIAGTLGTRAIWVFFVFPTERFNNLKGLYTVYPVSWAITIAFHSVVLAFVWRKVKSTLNKDKNAVEIK